MTTATLDRLKRKSRKPATVSLDDADAMWNQLRESFDTIDDLIVNIIRTHAWEPLGYTSFAAAWKARMSGNRLATDICKVLVVERFYREGYTTDETVDALLGSGVTPRSVDLVREKIDMGIDPDGIKVREHVRRKSSAPKRVHIEVSERDYSRYQRIAEQAGSTLRAEAESAVRAHFAALAKRK